MTKDAEWLHFARAVGSLKTLRRQGWIDRGVVQPESVADHSFRLAVLAWTLTQCIPGLHADRAAILALVHDLAECLAGDCTPFDGALQSGADRTQLFRQRPVYSPEAEAAKVAAERAALQQLAQWLPSAVAEKLVAAWEEYEAGSSPEARFVRELDKLETLLQALAYRQDQPDLVIESFVLGALETTTDPLLRALLEEALQEYGWTHSSA